MRGNVARLLDFIVTWDSSLIGKNTLMNLCFLLKRLAAKACSGVVTI